MTGPFVTALSRDGAGQLVEAEIDSNKCPDRRLVKKGGQLACSLTGLAPRDAPIISRP